MSSDKLTTEDSAWQAAAYEQFLRDDSPEDAIYESVVEERCPTKNQVERHLAKSDK